MRINMIIEFVTEIFWGLIVSCVYRNLDEE